MNNIYKGNSWPNAEQTYLLRACVLSGRDAEEAWMNWVQRVDFDQIDFASYKLLPLAARNPSLSHLQDSVFNKCRGIYRQTWVTNHLTWQKITSILYHLLEAGIDKIVLLKGMAMILHYYRDFGVRVIGDVDVLIARSRLPLAISVLRASDWQAKSLPFNVHDSGQLHRWNSANFVHTTGLDLDLHWGLILESSYKLDQLVLNHAKEINRLYLKKETTLKADFSTTPGIYVASSTDLLLQTCVHGLKQSAVPLIRWIADAMTILKQADMDWDRLVSSAKDVHICRPLGIGLQYLSEQFEAPIPKWVIATLRNEPSLRLEHLEYSFNTRGYSNIAGWFRYCLRHGYLSVGSQILHAPKYLQATALLKSPWEVPFFAVYWIFKRFCRLLMRLCRPALPKSIKI